MNARLSSLLVVGGLTLTGISSGIPAWSAETESNMSSDRACPLQGVSRQSGTGASMVFDLDLPTFRGQPTLQVLDHPHRVVMDLPGVIRTNAVTRKDLAAFSTGLVQRCRIAQFANEPAAITRVVFEVIPGTQATVQRQANGLRIHLEPGSGPVQAKLLPGDATQQVLTPSATLEPQLARTEGLPVTTPPSVQASLTPLSPLSPLPSSGRSFEALPGLSAATLLPTHPGQPHQEAPTSPRREDGRSGRTLGDTQVRYTGTPMTFDISSSDIREFLKVIADTAKLNIVIDTDIQGTYSFKFTDTPWDQVLDVTLKHAGLGKEIQNGVLRVAKVEKLQKEEEDRRKLDEAKALAGTLLSVTRPLSFAKVKDAETILKGLLTKRGTIITDERTQTLIITDLPRNIPVLDELIAQLDVQIQQVQIEARVVEANKNLLEQYGVKWPTSNSGDVGLTTSNGSSSKDATWGSFYGPAWNSANPTSNVNFDASGNPTTLKSPATALMYSANAPLTDPAGQFWVSFLSNRFSINFILQALEKEGKVKIVSQPKLTTMNNHKATILSGEKIPYPSQQGGSAGGAITVQFQDANLQLDVTPQITNDGTVIMDLKVDKAEADFSRTVLGTPTILKKSVETQVLVKDGYTAVLGGVYTTKTTNERTGVPFLSKIPVLGWLFRSKSDQEATAELLIFITPRILKS